MSEEKRKNDDMPAGVSSPCPICGETHYEWGRPGSEGGVYFLPEGTLFGFGQGEGLLARKCLRCGNVQLFIKSFYE